MFSWIAILASVSFMNAHQEERMTKNSSLQTVLRGRLDTFRSASLCSPFEHADFQERENQFLYAWGMDYVCGNGILEKDAHRIPSDEEIDKAIEYFNSKNLPFMWWSGAQNLDAKGFQFGGILTGIALDISENLPSVPAAPENLTIRNVESASEMRQFAELSGDAFAIKAIDQWFALNHSIMEKGEQIYFVATLDGAFVGTAALSVSPTSAGIWDLATLPEHRKSGVGTALYQSQ